MPNGPSRKRVVIPGGAGFLGRHLTQRLIDRGDHVSVLTRGEPAAHDGWDALPWDGRSSASWSSSLDGADAIVHLTGKRVDCRPTKRNIAELTNSRVDPVLAVGEAWRRSSTPPPVWVQLCSLAIFGDAGEAVIDEDAPPPAHGPEQMTGVCRRWEEAFEVASRDVPRSVLLRPSICIGGSGDPATDRLLFLAKMYLGGRIASGRQWVSWVSLDDLIAVILRAIDRDEMSGLYHVTSPAPVRNAEMMSVYRTLAGRRFGIPSPRLVTRAGAWVLGSDPELALTGRRGVPTRLLSDGYEFLSPSFERAAELAVRGATRSRR